MIMKIPAYLHGSNRRRLRLRKQRRGFTLVELLVVVGTLAVLALVLVPALAGTRMESWRLQCQYNLKQLQAGMQLFTQDHDDMFPPACYGTSGGGAITWDSWIYNYISGGRNVTVSQAAQGVYAMNTNDAATMGIGLGLPVVVCPVDAQLPKISWMHVNSDPTQPLQFAPKTYAMVSVGSTYGTDFQVNPQSGKYPLPDLNQPNRRGVGIYWYASSGAVDWEAKGYKTSVVKDPGGTILLCEVASSQGLMGNQWPCLSFGPYTSNGGTYGNLYQIDTAAPTDSAHLVTSGYGEGGLLYPAHGNRFNYLFHDGHVAALKIEQTVGSGTLTAPKGMWTVRPGD
jgi:prepilin-type processing-associated H-X9-DG protein/prepilin-type N-terminal cleavage/methylation domain-containing protein